MPTILKTKNSVTTTVVPTTLQQGELAVNITDKKLWVGNAATTPVQLLGAGVTGDVVGPASATDNAISRFDATTGKLIQNSLVTVSDTGAISAPVDASISGLTVGKGGGAVATNTAVGANALDTNVSSGNTVAIGYLALRYATTANNTAVGSLALSNASFAGTEDTAIGRAALLSNTTGSSNTAVGTLALQANTTASENTAIGFQAGYSNTTGTALVALGYRAGYNNTTGSASTAVGYLSGFANTTGEITAIGYSALTANTTGTFNTALGRNSLVSNTTGENNTAVGRQALNGNTTASNNTAVGYQAGFSNTTGTANFFGGALAGYSNTTGLANTAIGGFYAGVLIPALYTNTTGNRNIAIGTGSLGLNTTASNNTAVGYSSIYSNTTGTNNTAVGTEALASNTTASNNTAVGNKAGYTNTTGASSVFIGQEAGYFTTTGNGNTFIGTAAGYNVTTGSRNTFIGSAVQGSATGSGYAITTGSANTILGNYDGNNGGLDIRTASNYIVLSDGLGNPRLISDTNGQVGIGANPISTVKTYVKGTGTTSGTFTLYADNSSAVNLFYVRDDGAGYLKAAAWTYGSDASLKENIEYLTTEHCLTQILNAKPAKFDYIDGEKQNYGYVANDVETWLPEAVPMLQSGTRGLKDGFINALGTGAIQELYKQIQELNAKVEAQALEIAQLKGN
jgi:hypothetical protein